jgi:hypothetical protein
MSLSPQEKKHETGEREKGRYLLSFTGEGESGRY